MAEGLAQVVKRVGASVRVVANGDTEDVVQEACARAIKSGVSLEAEQWLRTVAKRVAIDQHRRRRETPSGAPVELENWIPSNDGNPEEALLRQERTSAVREALATLPPRYRKALMVYAEEDSPAAVANRLGMSAAATWTLLSRARSRLRLQLEQVGYVPAMVLSRMRWRGVAVAGAAGAVAATMAVVPMTHGPSNKAHLEQAAPKILHVSAADRAASAPKPSGLVPKLPVSPSTVTDQVNGVADTVQAAPATLKVGACLGEAKKETSVQVSVPNDPADPNLLARVVTNLPDRLKFIGAKTCS